MGADDRFWNRDELYEEVWSTPIRTLAKKYGISDVGLAKVCRKLMIPLPGRGYWAKKDAGHDVKRVALPQVKERIIIEKPPRREEPSPLGDIASDSERIQLEQLERSGGEFVPKRGSLSHHLIMQAQAVLKGAQVDDRKILWTREKCLSIRVSKDSLNRALRILAGVISTIEDQGFTVSVGVGDRGQTVAKIHGQEIAFGILEKVDRVEILAAPAGGLLQRVLTYSGKPVTFEPSGQLTIEAQNSWGATQKRWRDGKSHRLEEIIPQVVAGFIRIALAERAEKKKRAAEEREKQRKAEERARLEQCIKAEQSRVRALRYAAAQWHRAQHLRSFVAAARESAERNGHPVESGTSFGDWLVWAEQQADRIDPLNESPVSILDRKMESTPEYTGYYGYRKPEPPFRFPTPLWRMK